jgi:hypothetical protein
VFGSPTRCQRRFTVWAVASESFRAGGVVSAAAKASAAEAAVSEEAASEEAAAAL